MLEKTLKSYITIKDSLPYPFYISFVASQQINDVILLKEQKISKTEAQITALIEEIKTAKSLKKKKVTETDMKSKIQELEAKQAKLIERF